MGTRFLRYAPQILVMHPFFHNVPPKYCNVPAHEKKADKGGGVEEEREGIEGEVSYSGSGDCGY